LHWGLPLVGLEIEAISSGNSAVLWFGAWRIPASAGTGATQL